MVGNANLRDSLADVAGIFGLVVTGEQRRLPQGFARRGRPVRLAELMRC